MPWRTSAGPASTQPTCRTTQPNPSAIFHRQGRSIVATRRATRWAWARSSLSSSDSTFPSQPIRTTDPLHALHGLGEDRAVAV